MGIAEIRAGGRTPRIDGINRRTTELLILSVLMTQPVTKRSLGIRFRALARKVKKEDGRFFIIYPEHQGRRLKFGGVVDYFKKIGCIEEKEIRKKILICITVRGMRGYANLKSLNGGELSKNVDKAISKGKKKKYKYALKK